MKHAHLCSKSKMGSVALFPSAVQPIVRGLLWFPFALFYLVYGIPQFIVGIIGLPFGA
jgi:hypothetical protein